MEKPKSRRPDAWPPLVRQTVETAIKMEVLIPFENLDRVKEFRRLLLDIRRSYREHEHPLADRVNSLRPVEFNTVEIMADRPHYIVSYTTYPYTICLSPAMGFTDNLENALSNTEPHIPTAPPINLSNAEFEAEIAQLISERSDDANELADFIKSRKR